MSSKKLLLDGMNERQKEAVQTIKAAYPDMKVIVGGAPVTPEYATEIGADGYAPDAGSAAAKAKELIGA